MAVVVVVAAALAGLSTASAEADDDAVAGIVELDPDRDPFCELTEPLGAGRPGLAERDVLPPGMTEAPVGAADLDGDGADDILSWRYFYAEQCALMDPAGQSEFGGTFRATLTARKGSTGALLWERPLTDSGSYYRTVSLHRAGVRPVIVASEQNRTTGALELLSLSAEGSTRWSRSLGLVSVGGVAGPVFRGVLDADGDEYEDLLVTTHSLSYLQNVQNVPPTVHIISGADGRTLFARPLDLPTNEIPVIKIVPGLEGERDGFVVSFPYADASAPVVAYGADGVRLWSSEGLPFRATVATVGDATGDGVADLVAMAGYASGDPDTVNNVLLNGASGSVLWAAPGGFPREIGDVDGDGRSDVVSGRFDYAREGDEVAVQLRYVARNAEGVILYNAVYEVGSDQPSRSVDYRDYERWGDVDGDGTDDFVHSLLVLVYDSSTQRWATEVEDRRVVSGRTGQPVSAGVVGRPLYGSFDGLGADVFTVARPNPGSVALHATDAASGSTLWDREVPVAARSDERRRYEVTLAADIDADGRDELILFAHTGDTHDFGWYDEPGVYTTTVVALDSTTGATHWSFDTAIDG
ncbi:MAG: hypothetical protein ACT452_03695 [Microthrixaceae bacterium]